jgi:hypothetical protein
MAHARLAQFDGHLQNPEYLDQALRGNPRVIQIDLVGPVLGTLVTPTDAAIARQSFLRTKAGRTIPVTTVVFAKDFPTDPRISLAFPAQLDGQAALTPDDHEVRVVVQLGSYVLNSAFALREMVMNGEPSL